MICPPIGLKTICGCCCWAPPVNDINMLTSPTHKIVNETYVHRLAGAAVEAETGAEAAAAGLAVVEVAVAAVVVAAAVAVADQTQAVVLQSSPWSSFAGAVRLARFLQRRQDEPYQAYVGRAEKPVGD